MRIKKARVFIISINKIKQKKKMTDIQKLANFLSECYNSDEREEKFYYLTLRGRVGGRVGKAEFINACCEDDCLWLSKIISEYDPTIFELMIRDINNIQSDEEDDDYEEEDENYEEDYPDDYHEKGYDCLG